MKTSLIITTYNRAGLLARSLERLSELTVPDEIIVVDDGGDDDCEDLCVAMLKAGLPIRYFYLDNPEPTICCRARNVGLQVATGEEIITSEPELEFETDVIGQFLALREEHPQEVINCGYVTFLSPYGKIESVAHKWVATFAAMYKRDWLMEINGWDEGFPDVWGYDDTDLITRLRLNGHPEFIDCDVRAIHQWHPQRNSAHTENEAYFMSKSFHPDEQDLTDVVANKGAPWGQLTKSS